MTEAGGIDGFDYSTVGVGSSEYRVGVAGSGPPVLLLHGFPQTHYCWNGVAPGLTDANTVVVCDLKGVGASRAQPGGELGEGYAKHEIAAELVAMMAALGHARFAVVGHDRGARVAYRMALEHPRSVAALCVLNVVPTLDQFEQMAEGAALEYYPWFFLAQPPPFAQTLVAASAEYFVRHTMRTWPAAVDAIDEAATQRYVDAFTPEAIGAWCADYRAAFHDDRARDRADREAGRTIACPVLVHWGAAEDAMSDGPLPVWRRWADDVRGGPLPAGHFVPEEAAGELLGSLRGFLDAWPG